MNCLLMIIPFMILTIIALALCRFLVLNIAEGMVLSTTLVCTVLLFVDRITQRLVLGLFLIFILTILSILYLLVMSGVNRKTKFEAECDEKSIHNLLFTPYMGIFICIIIILCYLYNGDFIQHIDEFHQWAAAPRYMLKFNKIASSSDYIGEEISFATSIFIYFFERFTGFDEGLMYVINNIFYWVGFLLPLGCTEKKNWKNAVLYTVIIYISLYSLYTYGAKNLYVDVAVAAWAGGLLAWMESANEKVNKIVLLAGLFMLYEIKNSLGIALVIICCVFYLIKFVLVNHIIKNKKKKHFAQNIAILFMALVLVSIKLLSSFFGTKMFLMLIPKGMYEDLLSNGFSKSKITLTTSSLVKMFVGQILGSGGEQIAITALFVVILCLIMIFITFRSRKEYAYALIYDIYIVFGTVTFLFFLWCGYIFSFSYKNSIVCKSGFRYLSIWSITIFTFAIYILIMTNRDHENKQDGIYIRDMMLILVGTIFLLGINKDFIGKSTALIKEDIPYSEEISDIREQIEKINEIIDEDDQVYIISQQFQIGIDELPVLAAEYYMDGKLDNTHKFPYMFTGSGCIIRTTEYATLTIRNLPELLEEYNFSYVWIYKADSYLKTNLPYVMGDEVREELGVDLNVPEDENNDELLQDEQDEQENQMNQYEEAVNKEEDEDQKKDEFINSATIHDGQLYKVVYNRQGEARLRLVENLRNYDDRY